MPPDPWYVDVSNWAFLGLGLLLSIPIGVFINWVTPKTFDWFTRSNQRELTKRKDTELREYARMKALYTGREDRYFYFVYTGTIAILLLIFSSTCGIVWFIRLSLGQANEPPDTFPLSAVLAVTAIFCFLLSVLTLATLHMAGSRLANFKEYEQKVKEKWGLPD